MIERRGDRRDPRLRRAAKSAQYAAMTITIRTEHANELILVEEVLDSGGSAIVALGLINQDGSDTFPGRTLSPDQAEELAASLALSAAIARAHAGLAPAPSGGETAHAETLSSIRSAVPLTGARSVVTDDAEGESEQSSSRAAEADTSTAPAPAGPDAVSPPETAEPEEFPIDDYDALSAAVITKQLPGLSAPQLAQVFAHEQSHRNRKTICERIVALQAAAARTAPGD